MINQILFFSKAANEQPIKCLSNSQITKEYSWSDNDELLNSTGVAVKARLAGRAEGVWPPHWPKATFSSPLQITTTTACCQTFVLTGVEGQGALLVPHSQGTGDGVPRGQGWPGDWVLGWPGDPTALPHPAGVAGHPGPASSACLVVQFTTFPASKQIH